MDLDDAPAEKATTTTDGSSVFAHTKTETFLIFPQEDAGFLRYTIAVIVHSQTKVDGTNAEEKEPSPDGVADMSMSPSESSKTGEAAAVGAPAPVEKAQTDTAEAGGDNDEAKAATMKQAGDVAKSEDAVEMKEAQDRESVDKPAEPAPTVEDVAVPKKQSEPSKLQVLQRDLTAEQFIFELDGIGVVSNEVENGARKGWKMEVRSWRLAGADAVPLMQTVM